MRIKYGFLNNFLQAILFVVKRREYEEECCISFGGRIRVCT